MVIVLEIIAIFLTHTKLMDDILFAVTFSINTIFSKAAESVCGTQTPKDEDKPVGPFGVNK